MLFQYLSSRKLFKLKLAGSGSNLLFLGVTLLAFKEQLRCQQNEVRTGSCPCSWSLLACSGGRAVCVGLFLGELCSPRAVTVVSIALSVFVPSGAGDCHQNSTITYKCRGDFFCMRKKALESMLGRCYFSVIPKCTSS